MNAFRIVADVRHAVRSFRRDPTFTAAALVSLVLGIGASSAVFTIVDQALLRPLELPEPDRLVVLSTRRDDGWNMNFAYPRFEALRSDGRPAARLVAFSPRDLTIVEPDRTERVAAELVSPGYFEDLGVPMRHGRGLGRGEATAPLAVISDDFWEARFGRDPDVLGRALRIDGQLFTIVGVAASRFHGLRRGSDPAVWLPLRGPSSIGQDAARFESASIKWLFVAGRLADGVSLARARSILPSIFDRLEQAEPSGERGLVIAAGSRGYESPLSSYRGALFASLGAVAVMLLIACANVSALMLARATRRRTELAVRLALGASSLRIARQLIVESLALAAPAGAGGLLLASWLTDLAATFRPATAEAFALDTTPDSRVLGFTIVVACGSAVLVGLLPAIRAAGTTLQAQVGRESSHGPLTARSTLVVAQIALAMTLLVTAVLLTRSLTNLYEVDLGFDADQLLLASVDLGATDLDEVGGTAFYDRLRERLGALPGVQSVGAATTITPHPFGSRIDGVRLEGYQPAPGESIGFDLNRVSPSYFETLTRPILRGRPIETRDRAGAEPVAVIDERIARRYWTDSNPIGRRILLGTSPAASAVTIVGVVGAGPYRDLRAPRDESTVYLALAQDYRPRATLVIRSAADPTHLVESMTAAVRALESRVPITDVRTMEQHLALVLARERLVAWVSGLFSIVALALTSVGIYGLLAGLVASRTREIGIRTALGARSGDVLRLVLGRVAGLVGAGLGAGVLATFGATRLVRGLLFEVAPSDPPTILAVAATVIGAALLAAYVPARRAARVDPARALRVD